MHFTADAFVEEWLGPKHLGVKALATQHLLGVPYFKSVTEEEIVVEWQQMASHGRRIVGEDFAVGLWGASFFLSGRVSAENVVSQAVSKTGLEGAL
jgi:hypothetical protein